jgi:protease-4
MKRIFSWLKTVAKLINLTRLLLINLFFLILVIFIFMAINIDDQPVQVADNSTLHLNFTGNIVEQKQPIDFSSELSKQIKSSLDILITSS